MDEFTMFLIDGINHLVATGGSETNYNNEGGGTDDEFESKDSDNISNVNTTNETSYDGLYNDPLSVGPYYDKSNTNQQLSSVPIGTLAKMKDILISLEKVRSILVTGLNLESDLYSTNPEDYMTR